MIFNCKDVDRWGLRVLKHSQIFDRTSYNAMGETKRRLAQVSNLLK